MAQQYINDTLKATFVELNGIFSNTYFSVISDNIDLLNAMKDMYISYVVDTDDANISKRLKLKFAGMLTRLI